MSPVKRFLRPFVPQSIRQKIREARVSREMRIWQELDLTRELAGLSVKVASRSDWIIFNEIFVDRIYDRAIALALNQAKNDRMLNVLDLGANVGFFATRFSQMIFQ